MNQLQDLKGDPLVATEIMNFLGIGPEFLTLPYFFEKVKGVASFLNKVPTSAERLKIMRKVVKENRNETGLESLFDYTRINNEYSDVIKRKQDIDLKLRFMAVSGLDGKLNSTEEFSRLDEMSKQLDSQAKVLTEQLMDY